MKRSEVNAAIRWAEALLAKYSITLPCFGRWNESDWAAHTDDSAQLVKTMLGWDVTDFGRGDFSKVGAVLFTVRNGSIYAPDCGTPYAEKYILMRDGCAQEIPMHYHNSKTEDIINRAGGVLCLEFAPCGADGKPAAGEVTVRCDSLPRTLKAGEVLEIAPGDSVTIPPRLYHRFWAKTGAGDLIVGEVSKINDDNTDNVFAEPSERFCGFDEDEPTYRRLVCDY